MVMHSGNRSASIGHSRGRLVSSKDLPMNHSVLFENIYLIVAPGKLRSFTFELGCGGHSGRFARIKTDGYELVLDNEFMYRRGNFPHRWVSLVIPKLISLLEEHLYHIDELH